MRRREKRNRRPGAFVPYVCRWTDRRGGWPTERAVFRAPVVAVSRGRLYIIALYNTVSVYLPLSIGTSLVGGLYYIAVAAGC